MHQHGSPPRARQDGLLEETVGEELLLYDRDSHTAHCLSPVAACVWRHCDGEKGIAELAELTGASESVVANALHELREKDLLAAETQLTQSTIPGESRREAIGRIARYGAAATAGSLIVSATAATPAMASSTGADCESTGIAEDKCCLCSKSGAEPCETCIPGTESEADCKQVCGNVGMKKCRYLSVSICKS